MLSVWLPVLKTGSTGLVNKVLNISIRLFTLPLTLNYLGTEKFGIWILVASISGYIQLFDFGISSALVNETTKLNTIGNYKKSNEYILSSFYFISFIAVFSGVVSIPIIYNINWVSLFNLSHAISHSLVTNIFLIGIISFFIQLPLSIFLKIPYTHQKGHISELFLAIGNIVSAAGIVASVFFDLGILLLIFFLTIPQILAALGLIIYLLIKKYVILIGLSFKYIYDIIKKLRSVGIDFIVMQVVGTLMVALQFNLLGYFENAIEVGKYGFLTQIYVAIQMPFSVIQLAIWTKFVGLLSENKKNSVKIMMYQYFKIVFAYSFLIFIFFLFLINSLIPLVIKNPFIIDFNLRFAFALSCSLGLLFGGFMGSVVIALNMTRAMVWINISQLFLFLIVAFLLTPIFSILGIVIASMAGYIIMIPYYFLVIRKRLD